MRALTKLSFNTKLAINILCLAFGLLLIAGSLYIAQNKDDTETPAVDSSQIISKESLEKANGQNGNECLVAIDRTVYKIEGSDLWKNGEHTTSNGLAYCGKDLTEVLKQSPHGRTKLEQLEKIGQLDQ